MTTQPVTPPFDLEAEHADLLSAGPVPPAEAVTRLRIAGILDDHGDGAAVTDDMNTYEEMGFDDAVEALLAELPDGPLIRPQIVRAVQSLAPNVTAADVHDALRRLVERERLQLGYTNDGWQVPTFQRRQETTP